MEDTHFADYGSTYMSEKDRLPTHDDVHFAANLKMLREARGFTQSKLAGDLRHFGLHNMHPTTISRIESGDRSVKLSEARFIAKFFKTSVGVMALPPKEFYAAYDAASCAHVAAEGLDSLLLLLSTFLMARRDAIAGTEAIEKAIESGVDWADDVRGINYFKDALAKAQRLNTIDVVEEIRKGVQSFAVDGLIDSGEHGDGVDSEEA